MSAPAIVSLFLASAMPVLAQDSGAPPPNGGPATAGDGATLEGGDSVTEDLALDNQQADSVLEFPQFEAFFDPFFQWKAGVNARTGLQLQFSFQTLYQATPEDVPQQDTLGVRWQVQGSWALVDRGGPEEGQLTFRIENRYTSLGDVSPGRFASQFGSVTPSGTGFGDFDWALTEVAWRQRLLDGNLRYIFGKISATSWYNGHALSSPLRGFQNAALQSSLSKPGPGRGLGFGFGVELNPHWVALAGIHDANGETAGNPFDTIGAMEFYRSVELRYYPTTPDRQRFDQVRVQYWQQDALAASGTPAGEGMTFAASHLFEDRYFAYLLGGISDGNATLFDADIAAGFGVGIDTDGRAASDVVGIGVGWGRPSNDLLREQYTIEAFYRFQLVDRVALTPSIQYVIDPAANPEVDDAFVFGLRTRITF